MKRASQRQRWQCATAAPAAIGRPRPELLGSGGGRRSIARAKPRELRQPAPPGDMLQMVPRALGGQQKQQKWVTLGATTAPEVVAPEVERKRNDPGSAGIAPQYEHQASIVRASQQA